MNTIECDCLCVGVHWAWAPQGACTSRSITSIQLRDLCEQDKQEHIREGVCSRLNGLRVLFMQTPPSPLPLSAVGENPSPHGRVLWQG
jgi:hypothetical protein